MRDFPVFITLYFVADPACLRAASELPPSCLRVASELPPSCPPRLPPGDLICLLSPTTSSASASLAFVCSPGFDSSAWPRLFCRSLLVDTSAPSAGSSGPGHIASATSSAIRAFPLLWAAKELNCAGPRAHASWVSTSFLCHAQYQSAPWTVISWGPSLILPLSTCSCLATITRPNSSIS